MKNKRFCILIVIFVAFIIILTSFINTSFVTADVYKNGDVNNDGILNIADVKLLAMYVINKNTNSENILIGDMNGDNVIKINDITLLLKAILNGDNLPDVLYKTIYLNENSPTLNLNELSNIVSDNITWVSDNPTVASIENGIVTALTTGLATIKGNIQDNNNEITLYLTVKKKVIITIGASQVQKMYENVPNYSSEKYNYKVLDKTYKYVFESGTSFAYQTGIGWNKAKQFITSNYSSNKEYIEFYIFFPMPGNGILSFSCDSISASNEAMNSYVSNYNDVITNIKNDGYNIMSYVVSVQPVTSNNNNPCLANTRSNKKYYQFNKAIGEIINASNNLNIMYEYIFEDIMDVSEDGEEFNFKVTYDTLDGVHWNKATSIYYVDLMFKTTGLL